MIGAKAGFSYWPPIVRSCTWCPAGQGHSQNVAIEAISTVVHLAATDLSHSGGYLTRSTLFETQIIPEQMLRISPNVLDYRVSFLHPKPRL